MVPAIAIPTQQVMADTLNQREKTDEGRSSSARSQPPSQVDDAEPSRWSLKLSLTGRILLVNVLPLVLLGGGIIYLDSYRKQLLDERFKLALVEAQITAEALAGATNQRQEALLIQIGKEQRLRLRLYDPDGIKEGDSWALAPPTFSIGDVTGVQPSKSDVAAKTGSQASEAAPDALPPAGQAAETGAADPASTPSAPLPAPGPAPGPQDSFALTLDKWFDRVVGAPNLPVYEEPPIDIAEAWPELARARAESLTQIVLRQASDATHVITAAAPVGLDGETLLITRNPIDITESVREARTTVMLVVLIALFVSTMLSFFLAQTIVRPLRQLVKAAVRVRQGRDRKVEVPRLPSRRDEIGMLARATSDMTQALRTRIDAVESFAADVAHEIKNPLASLRSATESLAKVEDPDLRKQLLKVASHDVRRIDRLVTEISEASRIDAELSRATFEEIDLGALIDNIIGSREARSQNDDHEIKVVKHAHDARIMGEPSRLERVITNLLDNAVSFSPEDGPIEIKIERHGGWINLCVSDSGPGIPEEQRERVFQRFHSVRPDEEDFGQHSGLGLAIARTIAEAHSGTLTALPRGDGRAGARLMLELPALTSSPLAKP